MIALGSELRQRGLIVAGASPLWGDTQIAAVVLHFDFDDLGHQRETGPSHRGEVDRAGRLCCRSRAGGASRLR
jgi:hypothetical protein